MDKISLRGARRAVSSTSAQGVSASVTTGSIPEQLTVFTPAQPLEPLVEWAQDHRARIRSTLLEQGAILLRGFGTAKDSLPSFISAIGGTPIEYKDKATPRTHVGEHVYTSTDYPNNQTIELHHEMAYASTWPCTIAFLCVTPAAVGGCTPIANGYEVLRNLDPAILRELEQRKIRYVRNIGGPFGASLEEVFGTTDRQLIERRLISEGTAYEWRSASELRTWRIHPVTVHHPHTHERTWFNQITAFHSSTLEPTVREVLLAEMDEYDFPKNVFYGDGSPIEDDVLTHIRQVQDRSIIRFGWEEHDILLLDNMVYAHGRDPYEGERKILVGMCDPMSFEQLVEEGVS